LEVMYALALQLEPNEERLKRVQPCSDSHGTTGAGSGCDSLMPAPR
jgi:hypothetical protein